MLKVKMEKKQFSAEEDDILIDFVRVNAILFDTRDKNFRNAFARADLWEKIGKQLNKTSDDCIKRWSYIRDYYVKSRQKIGIWSSTPSISKRNEKLQFLDGKMKKNTITNIKMETPVEFSTDDVQKSKEDQNCSDNDDQNQLDEEFPAVYINAASCAPTDNSSSFEHTPDTLASTELKRKLDLNDTELMLDRNKKRMKSIEQLVHSKSTSSGIDNFFVSMCETTKKLPLLSQAEIKLQIADIVGKAEIEYLKRQQENDSF